MLTPLAGLVATLLQIDGSVEVLIEFQVAEAVHAAGATHVVLVAILQETCSSIALLRAYRRAL